MAERGTDVTGFKEDYRKRNEGDYSDLCSIILQKDWDLKYGENPSQTAAIYHIKQINEKNVLTVPEFTNLRYARTDDKGKGGLSLTNTMDITRSMDVLKFFDMPAVAIMKHNIVSGFAKQTNNQSMAELFRLARDADKRSNFGGTVVFNRPLDMDTAKALYELEKPDPFFVDVLASLGYEVGVIDYVQSKSKNVRIGEFSGLDKLPKFKGDDTYGLVSIKEMPTGRIGIQDIFLTRIRSAKDLILDPMVIDKDGKKHIVARDPTPQETDNILTAWYLNLAGARSNGIVVVSDGTSVAMGSGQVERVGAIEQALVKGMQKAMDREGIKYDPLMGMQGYERLKVNPCKGAVCASDAFPPFRDSIDTLARVGVTAVVQPFGSVHDNEVIDAANEYNIAMPATLERCFGHF